MTIHLFGDSYVEAERAESLGVRDHKRWYDILSEQMREEHINYGKCGEGPVNTLSRFLKCLSSKWFDKDDKFVFVLSSPFRIPWKWATRTPGPDGPDEYEAPSTIFQDFFSNGNKDRSYTSEQEYTLQSFYDAMYEECAYNNVKNKILLKHISAQNKWPMIVFDVFDINNHNPKRNLFDFDMFDLNSLNDDLFHLYPTALYEHSRNEWVNPKDMNEGMLNHFSERNHEILSNIMCNHFTGSEYPVKFHEKFILRDVGRENRNSSDSSKFVDFIYE